VRCKPAVFPKMTAPVEQVDKKTITIIRQFKKIIRINQIFFCFEKITGTGKNY